MEDVKLQPMKCELNYLSKSDGSAILAQGDTVVLTSVNGPKDIKTSSQNIEKATLEVLFLTKSGKPSVSDRYKENIIKQTCETVVLTELHPRTGISITVQELEDAGGLISCALNSTCLALLNAGVPMRSTFAAVACAVDAAGALRPGPPAARPPARASLHFVFDSRDKALITAFSDGVFSEATYLEALEQCRAASDLIFDFYREIIGKYSTAM